MSLHAFFLRYETHESFGIFIASAEIKIKIMPRRIIWELKKLKNVLWGSASDFCIWLLKWYSFSKYMFSHRIYEQIFTSSKWEVVCAMIRAHAYRKRKEAREEIARKKGAWGLFAMLASPTPLFSCTFDR